jgi:cold shock protein
MSLITRLIVSLAIAAIAAALTNVLLNRDDFDQRLLLLVAFFIATAATALIVGNRGTTSNPDAEQAAWKPSSGNATREHGTVKWFNVSKGFGFIVKHDGEEIFVHFRSIRGEGRRGLRDGQSVSFIVAQSDKGPQAEDVVPED